MQRMKKTELRFLTFHSLPGPWAWNQFLRDHKFDFIGASGNVEVKDGRSYSKCGKSFNGYYQ
jgi:hypothetical protein